MTGRACAGRRIDLDHAIDLMPALVVLEGDRASCRCRQSRRRHVVGVREERVVDVDPLFRRDVEQHGLLDVEHVAGLRVLQRRVFRLQLVLGRGLDVVNVAALTRPDLVDRELLESGDQASESGS